MQTVLIVMPLAEQKGGAELALLQLFQQGQDMRWLAVFLEDGPMVGQAQKLGVTSWVVPRGKIRDLPNLFKVSRQIAQIAHEEEADVLLGWMAGAQIYGSLAAIWARLPVLWFQHSLPERSWIDRIATLLPSQGILTCSKFVAAAQNNLFPQRPLRVAYPGVELERFDPSQLPTLHQARQKLGLPTDIPLIGIVGRLQRWKGMHVLVKALPQVLVLHPLAQVVIVGGKHDLEPDYSQYLKDCIDSLDLGNHVILTGFQRNIPEWMQAMDVVVHASDREPFGMVVVEAMALAKPVIAGAEGGPQEVITDGVDGLLTPFGDVAALAKALLRYLDEPQFRLQIGQKAQQRAQEFSTQRYAEGVVKAIRHFTSA